MWLPACPLSHLSFVTPPPLRPRPRMPRQQAVCAPGVQHGQEVGAAGKLAYHVVAVVDVVRAPAAGLLPRSQAVPVVAVRLHAPERDHTVFRVKPQRIAVVGGSVAVIRRLDAKVYRSKLLPTNNTLHIIFIHINRQIKASPPFV